jgi:hypothetical protein
MCDNVHIGILYLNIRGEGRIELIAIHEYHV